ncbi:MAG: hypothetical protein KJN63_05435 [Acidimicrobiia bacterium]|nr:hypothetical protein [Acidimicrobiia bacterium]
MKGILNRLVTALVACALFAAGCAEDSSAPTPGSLPLPTEDLDTVTAYVAVDGAKVEIRNGTAALEDVVRWALERYELAGLPVPEPNSITFTEYSDRCNEEPGRARRDKDGWHLYLCFCEEDFCPTDDQPTVAAFPQRVLLHELAHVWLYANATDQTRTEFMEAVGLAVWVDSSVKWREQACEYAAETLTWGLFDRPVALYKFGSPTDAELQDHFNLLTGRDALRSVHE